MKLRRVTSLTAMLSGLLMCLTSGILYIVPHGRIAYWSDWRLWGLSKTQWGNLHINLGILFLVSIFLHAYYNRQSIVACLSGPSKRVRILTPDFNAAFGVTVLVLAGTLFMLPPFSLVIHFGEYIKDGSAKKYGEPPYGHAELSSLQSLFSRTNLDIGRSLQRLNEAGIRFDGPDDILVEIASRNRMTPGEVFALMKTAGGPDEGGARLPDIPPPGIGRKTVSAMCREYGLDPVRVREGLEKRGITVSPEVTLKKAAGDNNADPVALYDIIREISRKENSHADL